MNKSSGKYYVKRTLLGEYTDITTLFNGVAVLSVDGMNEKGDAVNVYTAQWINEQEEDCMVTKQRTQSGVTSDVIIRSNVDLQFTFIISRRYATELIDVQTVYNNLIDYMCNKGTFYIKSTYANKEVKVVCLKKVKPTTQKLNRGVNSYILATIELHTLDEPNVIQDTPITGQELYIGFGNSTLGSVSDITSLASLQHYTNVEDVAGDYTILCPRTSYLWICSTMNITGVTSNGFTVPLNDSPTTIGDFYCYRSGNSLLADTINFTINT